MSATFRDLPPDHPIFSIGPSFVFKNDQPECEHDDDSQSSEGEDE